MISITKNLDEKINAVVGIDTTISITTDGTSYQWYECDDYDRANPVAIEGATTNSLDVTKEEEASCYYYCQIGKESEPFITSTTCKVETKNPEKFLTNLAHDKDILAAALAQLNGDNRDYSSMNYDQLVAEVMNLNLESGYTLPVASTTTLGGVKPDGSSITITNDGVISAVSSGDGTGDMLTEIYDTHNKNCDIFDYVDSKVDSGSSGGNSMIIDFNDSDKLFKKESCFGTISNITRTGNWTKDTTKLDEDGLPMWKSNSIGNSQSTTQKINFTTTENNQCVAINVYTSSENNYDWIYVSKLDSSFSTSNYTGKLSGIDKIDHFVVDIPNAGSHYINITYSKDYSSSAGQDCVWYSIKNENNGTAVVGTEILTNNYTDEMNAIFTKMLNSLEKGFWDGTCFKYNNNLYNIYINKSSSSNYYMLDLGYIRTDDISISSYNNNIINYKRLYIYKNRTEFTSETAYLYNSTYIKTSISVPKCTASQEGVITVDNITIKSNDGKISANSPIFIENDEFTDDIKMLMPENTIYCVIEEV